MQELEIICDRVSLTGGDRLLIQIGVSSGLVVTNYDSLGTQADTTVGRDPATNGFLIRNSANNDVFMGVMSLRRLAPGSNVWVSWHVGAQGVASARTVYGGGRIDLGAELDRIRITRTGTNAFDTGQLTVRWK